MRSIKKKLVLYLGILIAVICGGLGVTSYIAASNSLISNLSKTLPEIAEQASQSIEANVNGQLVALEAVAARSDISDPNLDPVQKRDILKKEAERLNSISIVYVDEKGDSIGSDGKVYNVADRDYIAKALSGTRNIAGPNVRKTDNTLSVRYVVPVRNGDKVIGALLESRDGNALSDYTDKIKFGTTGSGFLINNAGTTIAHKNRDKVLNQENIIKASEKDASLSSFADVYKTMIKRESGMANFNYKDKEYYIGYSPVQGTDWALGVIIHKSEVLSELADLKIVATASSVIAFIIGVILIYLLANMIANGKNDQINEVVERAFKFVSYLCMPITMGLMAVSQPLVSWFLAPEYYEVGLLTSLSSVIIIAVSFANIIGIQYLVTTKQENKYTLSILISAGVNLVMNAIIIKPYGALGAVISLIFAEFMGVAIQMFLVRKSLDIKKMLLSVNKYFISSVIMAIIVYFIGSLISNKVLANVVQVITGGIIYFTIMLIIKDELQMQLINTGKTYIRNILSSRRESV